MIAQCITLCTCLFMGYTVHSRQEKQHDDNIWKTEASANHLEGDWAHLLTAKPNWANGISTLPVETVSETTTVDASECT